jgi:hypothetical protein
MGSSVDAPPSRNRDSAEEQSQAELGEFDDDSSTLKLGELLSGRLTDADIDSVAAVREERKPK